MEWPNIILITIFHLCWQVSPEIKKNRVSLQPPVIHLNLSKYKYTAAVEGDRFNSYYFLYVSYVERSVVFWYISIKSSPSEIGTQYEYVPLQRQGPWFAYSCNEPLIRATSQQLMYIIVSNVSSNVIACIVIHRSMLAITFPCM